MPGATVTLRIHLRQDRCDPVSLGPHQEKDGKNHDELTFDDAQIVIEALLSDSDMWVDMEREALDDDEPEARKTFLRRAQRLRYIASLLNRQPRNALEIVTPDVTLVTP
jgi:hypothetical protein